MNTIPKAFALPLSSNGLIFDRECGAPIENYQGACRVYLLGVHQDVYTFVENGVRKWKHECELDPLAMSGVR